MASRAMWMRSLFLGEGAMVLLSMLRVHGVIIMAARTRICSIVRMPYVSLLLSDRFRFDSLVPFDSLVLIFWDEVSTLCGFLSFFLKTYYGKLWSPPDIQDYIWLPPWDIPLLEVFLSWIQVHDLTRTQKWNHIAHTPKMNSYLGLLSHTQSYRLRSKMIGMLDERFWEYFDRGDDLCKILLCK